MLPQMLTAFLDSATAFALPVTLLASTASTVFVVAGWRRRRELLQRQGRPLAADPIELGQTTFASGLLDVGSETTAVVSRFESLAAERFVALELAVQPGLSVHTDARALRQVLGDLVSRAIEQSPCGRVLLVAAHVGGRVQITVSDDGAPPIAPCRRAGYGRPNASPPCREPRWKSMHGLDRGPPLSCGCPRA
jgi:hypothetical protein